MSSRIICFASSKLTLPVPRKPLIRRSSPKNPNQPPPSPPPPPPPASLPPLLPPIPRGLPFLPLGSAFPLPVLLILLFLLSLPLLPPTPSPSTRYLRQTQSANRISPCRPDIHSPSRQASSPPPKMSCRCRCELPRPNLPPRSQKSFLMSPLLLL